MNSDRLAHLRALVVGEHESVGEQPDVVRRIEHLCRVAADALVATGVGVSVISQTGMQVTVAASSEPTEWLEELQFSLGEGPGIEAFESRRPVLVPDIQGSDSTRWPAYANALRDRGTRAVFSFPLQVGAARLGTLNVYKSEAGGLSASAMPEALLFAELATTSILDSHRPHTSPHGVLGAVDNRYTVFQAQGMVRIQLGVTLTEAMVRIRAHAYASDRRLCDIADDIVAGKLVLEPDAR